jgi:4-methylaminobutanoate oxidase (formaldehyde-forming)
MLNKAGGIESDLTVFRLADDHFRLMVGTAALKYDLSHIRNHLPKDADVRISDVTDDLTVLGLYGPDTAAICASLGAEWMIDLGYFCHAEGLIAEVSVRAARLSYVGESGWELTCHARNAKRLFSALASAGAVPVGAFAQASMRIEKGFLAYGHDLDTDMTPAMAGLEFTLAEAKSFIGKDALNGLLDPAKQLISLSFTDADVVPLGNEPIVRNGLIIGKTTSAAFGYRVARPVAIALIEKAIIADGVIVQVDIAGVMADAVMSVAPLFDPSGSRMRNKRS